MVHSQSLNFLTFGQDNELIGVNVINKLKQVIDAGSLYDINKKRCGYRSKVFVEIQLGNQEVLNYFLSNLCEIQIQTNYLRQLKIPLHIEILYNLRHFNENQSFSSFH